MDTARVAFAYTWHKTYESSCSLLHISRDRQLCLYMDIRGHIASEKLILDNNIMT
jgi:hypothetical protein